MPQAPAALAESAGSLFTPSTPNVDFLVMRQILRETGAATNRYACGIKASLAGGDKKSVKGKGKSAVAYEAKYVTGTDPCQLTITFSLPTSAYNNY